MFYHSFLSGPALSDNILTDSNPATGVNTLFTAEPMASEITENFFS